MKKFATPASISAVRDPLGAVALVERSSPVGEVGAGHRVLGQLGGSAEVASAAFAR